MDIAAGGAGVAHGCAGMDGLRKALSGAINGLAGPLAQGLQMQARQRAHLF